MNNEDLYTFADSIAQTIVRHYRHGIVYEVGASNIPYVVRTIAKEFILPTLQSIYAEGIKAENKRREL